jgi:hypothetical protein
VAWLDQQRQIVQPSVAGFAPDFADWLAQAESERFLLNGNSGQMRQTDLHKLPVKCAQSYRRGRLLSDSSHRPIANR